jgi:hypothetical protein
MAKHIDVPRKRRTRQHVIADLSVHHVEGFILEAGHTMQRLERDYGYDLLVFSFDEKGFSEPGMVGLQIKAAESLQAVGSYYVFDLDIRDYNLWIHEGWPVIVILYEASRKRAYWVHIQEYFKQDNSPPPKHGAKTIRVRVPKRQPVNRGAIAAWRDLKWASLTSAIGGQR